VADVSVATAEVWISNVAELFPEITETEPGIVIAADEPLRVTVTPFAPAFPDNDICPVAVPPPLIDVGERLKEDSFCAIAGAMAQRPKRTIAQTLRKAIRSLRNSRLVEDVIEIPSLY
jgi:hypothetical protein